MRLIKFTYRDVERVALEIEPDSRKINCLHCVQAEKGGEKEVGPRSFKVPEMRDVQPVGDKDEIAAYLMKNPEFFSVVQDEITKAEARKLLRDA